MNLPICKVCNKPVERMLTWTDDLRREDVFVVYCHGKEEEARLTFRMQAEANSIEVGFAFAGRTP